MESLFQKFQKTVEIHIIHQFDSDFYGQKLKAIILSFIRNESDFKSLDELITAIKDDITFAGQQSELPHFKKFQTDPFFTS